MDTFYQLQVSVLRWMVKLGWIDIPTETLMLALQTKIPREGCLDAFFFNIWLLEGPEKIEDGVRSNILRNCYVWIKYLWLEELLWYFQGGNPTRYTRSSRKERRTTDVTIMYELYHFLEHGTGHLVFEETTNYQDLYFWWRVCCNEEWHEGGVWDLV